MNAGTKLLLFLALAAYGQQLQQRVAVINTMDDGEPPIKILELSYLTDRLRETAVNVLPKSLYGVMTTESIVAFLGSEERAIKVCKAASCLAELGRMVSANYVAQARIGRFGENLTIKTELYDTKSGNLIGSFTGYSKDIYGLLTFVEEKAPDLFRKLPNALDNSSAVAAPAAAVALAAPQQEIESPPPPPIEEPSLETPPVATQEEAPAVEPKIQPSFFGWQLGLRAGVTNHGLTLGIVRDIAITEWFYIQPGFMYIQKDMMNNHSSVGYYYLDYLELPLLLSLKFPARRFISALTLNAGPYFGLCINDGGSNVGDFDFGISLGVGFNIWKFYIGAFGEGSFIEAGQFFGFSNVSAFGVQVGVNL